MMPITKHRMMEAMSMVHPLQREKTLIAYREAGCDPSWIEEAKKLYPPCDESKELAEKISVALQVIEENRRNDFLKEAPDTIRAFLADFFFGTVPEALVNLHKNMERELDRRCKCAKWSIMGEYKKHLLHVISPL